MAVPDDYTRARIRCPECGVLNDVPVGMQKQATAEKPRRKAPTPETDIAAEEILLGNDPPPPPVKEKPRKRPSAQAIQAERPRAPAPLHPPPPSPNANASDEDDGRPYRVPSLDDVRPCPSCRKAIPRDAVFCTSCGYNLRTGEKAKKEFEPFEREWQGGLPVKVRRGLFIAAAAFNLTACVLGALAGVDLCVAIFPCLLFTAMTAFLVGTYDRLSLTRNKKGRVRLTKTWTFCFVPQPPQVVDVHEYGDVAYGPYDESSFMEWMVLLCLLMSGILPGLLWFYFVFIRTHFQVAITKDHGHDELVLYRGSNQQMVLDIAETLREVAFKPWRQG